LKAITIYTPEYEHKCDSCNKTYQDVARLNRHIKQKHPGQPLVVGSKGGRPKLETKSQQRDLKVASKEEEKQIEVVDKLPSVYSMTGNFGY